MVLSKTITSATALLGNTLQNRTRWALGDDCSICWSVEDQPHQDCIEMSGQRVSVIVKYGVDKNGRLQLRRHIVWPMLRTVPNNTHASLSEEYCIEAFPEVRIDGNLLDAEMPIKFRQRGLMMVDSNIDSDMRLSRTLFPSIAHAAVIENCVLTNTSDRTHRVDIGLLDEVLRTDPSKGVDGEYILEASGFGAGSYTLRPGHAVSFSIVFTGRKAAERLPEIDPAMEQKAREGYVEDLLGKLELECPDPVIQMEFAFCKIRAAESIFDTKGGLMHAPGGGPFYAAIWANDQAEYANPFFPFLGDFAGNESALNSFRMFASYMNPEYEPIPSSIIAEGTDIWKGAGDRGDAAMIAYGASRYALARGDVNIAEELWPLITWCLEYCLRRTDVSGVIRSDCDELEGRFPAGHANLCTSSLAYDALISASILARELGKPHSLSDDFSARAAELRQAIERHFGADVEGFSTYRYYDGNTTLRAWICMPLAMGIFDRKDSTIDAIFSPKLWGSDGLLTESGKDTFWDRSTLYALRGVFDAGEGELALKYLRYYSIRRLLGDHVPYPVEEGPGGDQRHLAAESALYCRVITEGLFGIRPVGLRKFRVTPHLPDEWDSMSLRRVHGFGNVFDVDLMRRSGSLVLKVTCDHGIAVIRADARRSYTVILQE